MSDLLTYKRRLTRSARRRRDRWYAYTAVVVSAAFASTVWFINLSWQPALAISQIMVTGNALVNQGAIVGVAEEILADAYGGLWAKRNKFTIPYGEIRERLLQLFPAIRVAVITAQAQTMHIAVTERETYALSCTSSEIPPYTATAACFFTDQSGLRFAVAPTFSHAPYIVFIDDPARNQISSFVLPEKEFIEFAYFLQSLNTINLGVEQVVVNRMEGRGDVELRLTGGARLLINLDRPLATTLSAVSTFFNDPEIAARRSAFLHEVDYVDFRFADRVYYRLR